MKKAASLIAVLALALGACGGCETSVREEAAQVGEAFCEWTARCQPAHLPRWDRAKVASCAQGYVQTICNSEGTCEQEAAHTEAQIDACLASLADAECFKGPPAACDGLLR
jgi:hypothetical protein